MNELFFGHGVFWPRRRHVRRQCRQLVEAYLWCAASILTLLWGWFRRAGLVAVQPIAIPANPAGAGRPMGARPLP